MPGGAGAGAGQDEEASPAGEEEAGAGKVEEVAGGAGGTGLAGGGGSPAQRLLQHRGASRDQGRAQQGCQGATKLKAC